MSSNVPKGDARHVSNQHILRAERHFGDLKTLVNRFLEDKPYVIERRDHISGTHIISRRRIDIPDDIAWCAVCIIERMRSALDSAVFKIVEMNGHGTSGVGFPFGGIDRNTGKPYVFPNGRMTGKDGIAKKLTTEQWRFIESQRPYPGGNDLLWAINEVANAIKHRAILVEARPFLSNSTGLAHGYFGMVKHRPVDHNFILRDKEREEVLIVYRDLSLDAKINLGISVDVVFSDIPPVSGKKILTTLNKQIGAVKFIVKELSQLV